MKNNVISQVVKDDLCTGCGTCAALCSREAIQITMDEYKGIYTPDINEKRCNNCNICFEVCPGQEVDYNELNLKIFGKHQDNYLIGNHLKCYIGHSNDENIQYNSSSGGLLTQLLIFALEKRIIDGALVTRMKKDNPLEPEPFIARTRDEIIEASKSKYCPVPANIALKEILNSKGEKFAVVGLPCHLNGIRKAELINKKLKEKIILSLGIYCSHTDSFKGTEYLYKKLNIKTSEISGIDYRGLGWPGKVKIKLKNGSNNKVKLGTPLWVSFHDSCVFSPIRCLLCNDVTAELSDVSFGDAWLPEVMEKENRGESILISRSNEGENLLNLAMADKCVKLSPISSSEVIKSQKAFLHIKKINIHDRIKFRSLFGKKSPKTPEYVGKISFYNKFLALSLLINSFLGSKLGDLSKVIPLKIFKLSHAVLSFLNILAIRDDFHEK